MIEHRINRIRRTRASRRSGVSILEVMISIGVATVGLLGVVLLLPVALHQIRQGTLQDRAARVGNNAVRELRSRGLLQPGMLVAWNGNAWLSYSPNPFQGFCLDPQLIVAVQQAAGNQSLAATFPYTTPAPAFPMQRVTLLNRAPTAAVAAGTPVPLAAIMGASQADRIFLGADDLRFEAPAEDRTFPAVQIDDNGQPWNPSQPGASRQAEGRLSWIATFSPKEGAPNAANNASTNPNDAKFASNLFTMSIVVIYNRDPAYEMNQSIAGPPANPANERSVVVSQWHGAGYGGGDVELMTYNATADAKADLLDIRRGSWVMLSPNRAFNPTSNPATNVPAVFRWYRVAAADDEPELNAANYWTLNVTLEGADWLYPALTVGDTTAPGSCGTRVTVVKDVIAVYEKTVRMQNHSLWTVQ